MYLKCHYVFEENSVDVWIWIGSEQNKSLRNQNGKKKKKNLKASYKKLFIHLITRVHLDTFSILLTTVHVCMLSRFSCVHLFSTRWTVARQAPLSIGIL